ncbi:MAG: RNA polymerase sigma-70 factor [Pedobacter sp.]|uniref:RNA polymerase sigma factor n=1 Tax=Pedobacter sp. TaxID=1411316 RepID=UPI003564027A
MIASIYNAYSDHKLSLLLNQGDRKAFVEIYDRYYSLLYLYAYKKLKEREEAKDAVQDVFIALWNRREEIKFDISLSGYLYRSVRNRALNIFAHKNIESKYLASLDEYLKANHEGTDYLIREKEIAALIEIEINNLPLKMREVFLLSRTENLTYKEIAEKLNISETTVNTQMKRALKALRTKLGIYVYIFIFINS